MFHFSLKRVTLALILLELACLGHFAEAAARIRGAHHHRQMWNIPSPNWFSWSPWSFQLAPSNRTPKNSQSSTPAPAASPAQPMPSLSSSALASSVQSPKTSSLPLASPVQSFSQQTSSPLAAPATQLASRLSSSPLASSVQSLPSATQTPLVSIPAPMSTPLSTTQTPAILLPTTASATRNPVASVAPSRAATQLPTASVSPTSAPLTSSAAIASPSVKPILQSSSLSPSATPLPAVSNQTQTGCSNPRVRPEWRSLSHQQQASYITAVKCLAKLPSKLLPGGDYRRYDDFENVHSRMRTKIHWMALFLPWHRHFMFVFEQALRNECGYTGNLPRWDWTLDSDDMTASPVWSADPEVGFGSNGRNFTNVDAALDGGAITDGAFANWDLYYPEYHQLQRNYNLPSQYEVAGRSWGSQYFDQASISKVQSQTTYAKFAVALEGTDPSSTGPSNPGPHSIIHVIIGGDISPTSYAANEPLFYLHHTNVDYHWWRWQNAQRSSRLNAYGGPTTRGSTQDTAKLTDSLQFLSIDADVQVKDTMDTLSAKYCYTY